MTEYSPPSDEGSVTVADAHRRHPNVQSQSDEILASSRSTPSIQHNMNIETAIRRPLTPQPCRTSTPNRHSANPSSNRIESADTRTAGGKTVDVNQQPGASSEQPVADAPQRLVAWAANEQKSDRKPTSISKIRELPNSNKQQGSMFSRSVRRLRKLTGGHGSSEDNSDSRIFYANSSEQAMQYNADKLFSDNLIVTSNYTPYNFVFKYLWYQFQRFANAYFLFVTILQVIPAVSITEGLPTQALPLSFVLAFDGVLTALEDYRRHLEDAKANSTPTRILRGIATADEESESARHANSTKWYNRCCRSRANAPLFTLSSDSVQSLMHATRGGSTLNVNKRTPSRNVATPNVVAEGTQDENKKNNSLAEVNALTASSPVGSAGQDEECTPSSDSVSSLASENFDGAVRTSSFVTTPWRSVRVGDIVKVKAGEIFPADLLFLSAVHEDPEENMICFVRTAQLDGESNLKLKKAPNDCVDFFTDDNQCAKFQGWVEAGPPDANFDRFSGTLFWGDTERSHDPMSPYRAYGDKSMAFPSSSGTSDRVSLSASNLLLRGCELRNCQHIYGLVVYTGEDTKIRVKAQKKRMPKFSSVDKAINSFIIRQITILIVLCMVGTTGYMLWRNGNEMDAWYLEFDEATKSQFLLFVERALTFFLLNAQLIPISLYVSMKLARQLQKYFIEFDEQIRYKNREQLAKTNGQEGDYRTIVRTMDLNDECGQISHIFSDKTGTLTVNSFDFRKLSVNGVAYGLGTTPIGVVRRRRQGEDVAALEKILQQQSSLAQCVPHVNFIDGCEDDGVGWEEYLDSSAANHGQGNQTQLDCTADSESKCAAHSNRAEGSGEMRVSPVSQHSANSVDGTKLPDNNQANVSIRQPKPLRTPGTSTSVVGTPQTITPSHIHAPLTQGSPASSTGERSWRRQARARSSSRHSLNDRVSPSPTKLRSATNRARADTATIHEGNVLATGASSYSEMGSIKGDSTINGVIPPNDQDSDEVESISELLQSFDGSALTTGYLLKDLLPIKRSIQRLNKKSNHNSSNSGSSGNGLNSAESSFRISRTNDEWQHDPIVESLAPQQQALHYQLLNLTLDHSVEIEVRRDDYGRVIEKQFSASSPDEEAFVAMASLCGYLFKRRKRDRITLEIYGHPMEYQIAAILPYSQERKMMSVVVKDLQTGSYTLYAKGADAKIISLLPDRQLSFPEQRVAAASEAHMTDWADDGLRTMAFAWKPLRRSVAEKWLADYRQADADIIEREKKARGEDNRIDQLMDEMEQDLVIQGATGIEDRLQDQVGETIATLADAGIKIYMLTGDKQETAINIGYAVQLLHSEQKKLILTEDTLGKGPQSASRAAFEIVRLASELKELEMRGDNPVEPMALIVDDPTIGRLLDKGSTVEERDAFVYVAEHCATVICCRCSPSHKKDVLRMIKDGVKGAKCLAIGDGANDVDMIVASNVGVGIVGAEGAQAANNADYAIAQFRFLQRLLLVHGRWNYRRMGILVPYLFYKNFVFTIAQFAFSVISGWSGQKVYLEFAIQTFNLLYTGLPVLLAGIWEQDVDADSAQRFPYLYTDGRLGWRLNNWVFMGWLLSAIWEAVAIYICCALTAFTGDEEGQTQYIFVFGAVVFTGVVVVTNVRLALHTTMHHWTFQLAVLGSVLLWIPAVLVFDQLNDNRVRGGIDRLFMQPSYWLALPLIAITALIPTFAYRSLQKLWYPTYRDVVHEAQIFCRQHNHEDAHITQIIKRSSASRYTKFVLGYASSASARCVCCRRSRSGCCGSMETDEEHQTTENRSSQGNDLQMKQSLSRSSSRNQRQHSLSGELSVSGDAALKQPGEGYAEPSAEPNIQSEHHASTSLPPLVQPNQLQSHAKDNCHCKEKRSKLSTLQTMTSDRALAATELCDVPTENLPEYIIVPFESTPSYQLVCISKLAEQSKYSWDEIEHRLREWPFERRLECNLWSMRMALVRQLHLRPGPVATPKASATSPGHRRGHSRTLSTSSGTFQKSSWGSWSAAGAALFRGGAHVGRATLCAKVLLPHVFCNWRCSRRNNLTPSQMEQVPESNQSWLRTILCRPCAPRVSASRIAADAAPTSPSMRNQASSLRRSDIVSQQFEAAAADENRGKSSDAEAPEVASHGGLSLLAENIGAKCDTLHDVRQYLEEVRNKMAISRFQQLVDRGLYKPGITKIPQGVEPPRVKRPLSQPFTHTGYPRSDSTTKENIQSQMDDAAVKASNGDGEIVQVRPRSRDQATNLGIVLPTRSGADSTRRRSIPSMTPEESLPPASNGPLETRMSGRNSRHQSSLSAALRQQLENAPPSVIRGSATPGFTVDDVRARSQPQVDNRQLSFLHATLMSPETRLQAIARVTHHYASQHRRSRHPALPRTHSIHELRPGQGKRAHHAHAHTMQNLDDAVAAALDDISPGRRRSIEPPGAAPSQSQQSQAPVVLSNTDGKGIFSHSSSPRASSLISPTSSTDRHGFSPLNSPRGNNVASSPRYGGVVTPLRLKPSARLHPVFYSARSVSELARTRGADGADFDQDETSAIFSEALRSTHGRDVNLAFFRRGASENDTALTSGSRITQQNLHDSNPTPQ